ncbi:MAG TPA: DmsE family decaheme c-type cytochrome [Pyrinomonadaceae bacterium]|nr:DmsE family decaheme c-type cytochrome [Pyrinomonadaceae bacterium]
MALNIKIAKLGLLGLSAVSLLIWLAFGSVPTGVSDVAAQTASSPATDDNYVGSETCAGCHEPQAKGFESTKHAKLGTISSWKDKRTGCESCHGPGKQHVEGGGDKLKIVSFKQMDPKASAETCLACHAGKEAHNNFRRGEHWRNNVSCNTCHTAHGPEPAKFKIGSTTFVSDISAQNPGQATAKALRANEPQLCMACHNETKAQFTKPFHHKVLEGTMNCSDCHNAHGGYEQKQTKVAVGADAACIKCHANKQGPFVFEHAPLKVEGCTSCHTPHGSSNPKMLKRAQVRQLCFECHTGISEELSPGVPSRHNQAQMREQNCTVCHSAIHGSNSHRLFFR